MAYGDIAEAIGLQTRPRMRRHRVTSRVSRPNLSRGKMSLENVTRAGFRQPSNLKSRAFSGLQVSDRKMAGRQGFVLTPDEPQASRGVPEDVTITPTPEGRWLGGRDSNPDNVVQSHVSYR